MERLPGVTDEPSERIVCHVDMDCFYASCERLREQKLRGEPVVVGMGYEPGETIGAVATASYEARECGVESAQPISEALDLLPRREPSGGATARDNTDEPNDGDNANHPNDQNDQNSRVNPADSTNADADTGDTHATETDTDGAHTDDADTTDGATGYYRPVEMDYYESVAAEVKTVLHDIAETVREVSIDEAYLDVTDRTSWERTDDGRTLAEGFGRHVRQRIDEAVGVPASVGVAPNMAVAKVASDHDKPDGLTVVPPGEVASFLAALSVETIHGVGPVRARELREMGIETAGELADADPAALTDRFGDRGRELHERARGRDDREVTPRGRPKSLSRESAFAEATADADRARERIRALAADVAERARSRGATYRTIGVKAVRPPFEVNTRAESLSGPVDDPELVERVALTLFDEFAGDELRKLGVRVSNLSFADGEQSKLGGYENGAGSGVDTGKGESERTSAAGATVSLSEFAAPSDERETLAEWADAEGTSDRPERPSQPSLREFDEE